MTTKAEQAHKARLVDLCCMVCRRVMGITDSPAVLHHQRGGRGGWGKGDYTTLMPLCPEHHDGKTGVHGLGTRGFVKHYGFTEADLLGDVNLLLRTIDAHKAGA